MSQASAAPGRERIKQKRGQRTYDALIATGFRLLAQCEFEAITIADFAFTGATSVAVGETLTITNEDSVGHTWTSTDGQFDSGSLAEGATFEHTFDEAGSYDYFCSVHPDMSGTITAEA